MAKRGGNEIFFREALLEIERGKATGRGRLSIASEHPVLRRDPDKGGKRGKQYWEVLSHNPTDVDLDFFNRDGLVLQDHDEKKEIGTVEKDSATVDNDRKTRATVLVDDAEWQERMKEAPEAIPISVGYERGTILQRYAGEGGIEVRVYPWSPYETSLLTKDPADSTVGFNREKFTRGRVKHRCGRCGGHGRCDGCRADGDDDKADKNCETCEGSGDCPECGGAGNFESARSQAMAAAAAVLNEQGVDSLAQVDVNGLKPYQRAAMNLLLKADPAEGGGQITEADKNKVVLEARAAEKKSYRERQKEISTVVALHKEKHGQRDFKGKDGKVIKFRDALDAMGNEALQGDESLSDFKLRCMEGITACEPVDVTREAAEDVGEENLAQFSLLRAIQTAVKQRMQGKEGRPQDHEGQICAHYEKKCRESENGMGISPMGFIVPPYAPFGNGALSYREALREHKRMRDRYGRDMQATVFGAGGALVPSFWQQTIELLRNKSVLNRTQMRSMAGLTGDVIFPRLEAPSTAVSVAEIALGQASQQTLGQLKATPHRVFNEVDYSRQLVFQSAPDAEALIRDDMFQVLALKKDYLGLNGSGGDSEPVGIFQTPGIGTETFGGTPTYKQMVAFETAIRQFNVMGKLSYVSTSLTKGSLKVVAEALTGATTIGGAQNAIWKAIGGDGEDDGVVNGCQAIDSQQIPNNLVLAGVFNHLVECIWSGLDIVVDYFTKASNAEVRLVMNLWLDYLVRHAQAFCVSTDAGNQ